MRLRTGTLCAAALAVALLGHAPSELRAQAGRRLNRNMLSTVVYNVGVHDGWYPAAYLTYPRNHGGAGK